MLELIFQGFFEWIYGLILECWEYFASALLDVLSLDFAYLKTHIPIINDIMQVLLAVGWALLLGNLVFQATKSMLSGLGFEGEDPKLLFARTFVFAFLLLASPQICEIGLNLTSTIMDLLEVPDAVNVQLVDDSAFGSLTAAWLLVIICDVILMFKVLKLLVEIAERYIILAVLTITAPLAFATGGSRNTSDIFKGWCRMYGSMCLLMATHVIIFKMLLSVVSTVPSGIDVLPWMVLVFGIVKAAKKADAIITRIGLNPALTGGGGRSLPGMLTYAVVRGAASSVSKAIGKSMGGKGHGRSSGGYSPTGGGPRSGGPWGGGRWSGGYYGGGRAASAGAAGTAGTPGTAGATGAAGTAGTPPTSGGGTNAQTGGSSATAQQTGGARVQTQQTVGQQTTNQQATGAQTDFRQSGLSKSTTMQGAAQQKPQGGTPQNGTQPQGAKQPQRGAASNLGVSQPRQGGPDQQTRKTAVPPGTKLAPSYVTGGAGTTQAASGAAGKPTPGGASGGVAQNGGPRSNAGQPRPGGVSPMGKAPTAVAAPGAVDKEQTRESASTSRKETRSTNRPAVSPTAGTTRPVTTSGAVQPGTAGMGAQKDSVTAKQTETRSTRRVTEARPQQTSPKSAPTAQPGTAGRASSKDETASVQTETRSTHRTTEVASKQAPSSTPATVQPGKAGMGAPGGGTASVPSETHPSQRGADLTPKRPAPVAPPPAQPGTAGKAASTSGQAAPQTQPRQSRNVTPPSAGVSSEGRRPSPAPQEGRRASAPAQPEGKGTTSSSRPGTAGTAPKAEKAGKAPRTAMRQPGRAAPSPAPIVGKENPARKTAPKPPKRERGPGHGG